MAATNIFEKVGTAVKDEKKSNILYQADINFDIKQRDLYYYVAPSGNTLFPCWTRIKEKKALFRKDTGKLLGVVGESYSPITMKQALSVLDPLVKEGWLTYEYAGSSTNGKGQSLKCWVVLSLNSRYYEVTEGDKVLPYSLLSNSFDGSTSVTIKSTSIRMTCWNQNLLAMSEKGDKISTKHTGQTGKRFRDTCFAWLEKLLISFDKNIKTYEKMNDTKLTMNDFNTLISHVFLPEERDPICWKHYSYVYHKYIDGDKFCDPRTVYSAYNSVTSLLTHQLGDNDASRFYSNNWGSNQFHNKKAFDYLITKVK